MNFIDKMVERFIKLNRRMKRWQRVVSVMAAVVVFATTYALVLPAITLDKDTATTQAGIEIAASENESDEAGTVFESEQEDPVAEEEPEEAEEPAVEEDTEEAVAEEPSNEEDSSSESGSQEAEVFEAEADETEAAETEAVDEADASKTESADESEQAEVQADEEAAANGTTEEAVAAVTGQTAEEAKLITEDTRLTYEADDYVVYADFGESAKLPEGVQLRVKEITKESDPEAYEAYYQKALSEMQDKYDENVALSFAKFYDIAFVYEGVEIEPSGYVDVKIEYKKAVEIEKNTAVDTIHFDKNDEEKAEVIDSDTKGSEESVEAVEFKSDQFSVYGIIGAELYAEITLPGSNDIYVVTVTAPAEAKIPQGSTLRVEAFEEGSEKYEYARNAVLADKKEKGEIVNLNDFNLAALDISIIDPDGNEIEPEAAVQVDIKIKELPGVEDLEKIKDTLEIQHHVEVKNGVVVEKVFDGSDEGSFQMDTDESVAKAGTAVDPDSVSEEDFLNNEINDEDTIDASFGTEVFSTFTITWRNNDRRVTVHYVDENGTELTISNPDNTHPNLNATSFSPAFLIYDIEGYEYAYTYRNSNNNRIAPILYKDGNGTWLNPYTWRYSSNLSGNNPNWTELNNNDNIYVVYRKQTDPTTGGTAVIDTDEDWPEGEDAPQFSKSSVNNGDGTNIITLSIAAGEKPVEENTPADVIVIFDRSGSMSTDDMSGTRLQAAKTATNQMAQTLLGNNSDVRMALVSFSNTANLEQDFTSNYTTFSGKVNALGAEGGTNWEQALYIANRLDVREDAATFVVFVTDGDPTFRISRGDITNNNVDHTNADNYRYIRQYNVFGAGASDNQGRNLAFAVDQVKSINGSNKSFYAIGISNDVTKVRNLTTQGGVDASHAFIASDRAAMDAAFKSITESIKAALGFGDVEITDGITELTNAEMKVMQTVDPDSFQYYRWGGEGNKYGADEAHMTEWTTREADGCAAATYDKTDGAVHWDMGEGFQLEDGVHYVVTFRVWPSQEAYDLVADLNNGVKTYDTLTDEEKAQIVEVTAVPENYYALKTNTDTINATYSQTSKTGGTVTVSGDQDIEATYHEGDIENMNLTSMLLTVKKEFEDDLTSGEDRDDEVVLVMKRRNSHQNPEAEFEDYPVPQGGTTSANIVLNEQNGWSYHLYIAPGLEVDGEVLEHGYDFTITEPDIDYHYGLIEEIINPMVVDGVEQYYGDGELIDGDKVPEYMDRSLTAVNRVKSGIDIWKHVYDVDGTTEIYPDTEFTITGKLLDKDGNPFVWHDGDDIDASGAYHKYDKDGNRIIYKGHFEDSSNISFTLKAGEYIRFINVPDDCTFEFTETVAGMDALGYEWMSTEAVTQHRTSPGGDFTPDGDVQPEVSGQTASLPTGVVGNKQYAVTYSNKRTIPLSNVDLVKVDATDNDLKLNDAEFALYSDAELTKPITVDGNGKAIAIKTGNKEGSEGPDGWYNIGLLPAGTYYMVETTEPVGYVHDETPVIITVTKGTNSYTVTATKNGESVISGPVENTYTITVDNERITQYVKVFKYETGSNPEKPLEGAEFTLTGPEETGIEQTGLLTEEDGYLVFADNNKYIRLPFSKDVYTLSETAPPSGYNPLTEDITFTVAIDGVNATGSGYTVTTETETIDDKEVTVYVIKVQNSSGTELPLTGGPGTLHYTLGGLMLILASALMYGFRMRRGERRFR